MKHFISLLIIFKLKMLNCHKLERCSPGYYRCSGYDPSVAKYVYSKCIREDLICDGKQNCFYNEDESDCEGPTNQATSGIDLKESGLPETTKQMYNDIKLTRKNNLLDVEPTTDVNTVRNNPYDHGIVKKSEAGSMDSNDSNEKSSEEKLLYGGIPNIINTTKNIIDEYPRWIYSTTLKDTTDENWIKHDSSPFPINNNSMDSHEKTTNHDGFEVTTDWLYEISTKNTDGSTWIYDIITEDSDLNNTSIEDTERTHIELLISIIISIIIVFILVTCVIFQKKLSRSKKRRKSSIGTRMRIKYGQGTSNL